MIRQSKLFATLGLLLAMPSGPALASSGAAKADHAKAETHGSEHEGKDKDKAGEHEKAKPSDEGGGLFSSQDNLVPLPTLIAPVLLDDRLTAHLYIYIAALTASASDAKEVKMRLPYVQDAMVREVNVHALTISDTEQDPDTKAMIERLKIVINEAVGKPLVTELQVGRIDTAPY